MRVEEYDRLILMNTFDDKLEDLTEKEREYIEYNQEIDKELEGSQIYEDLSDLSEKSIDDILNDEKNGGDDWDFCDYEFKLAEKKSRLRAQKESAEFKLKDRVYF